MTNIHKRFFKIFIFIIFVYISGISGLLSKSTSLLSVNSIHRPNSHVRRAMGGRGASMPLSLDSSTSLESQSLNSNKKTVAILSASAALLDFNILNVFNKLFIGGFLAGSLHAITGPDHLAALLPSSMGRTGFTGLRIGAVWGLGHSISATTLGLCSFFLKNKLSSYVTLTNRLSTLMESVVGFSLIAIGLIGIKENTGSPSSAHQQSSTHLINTATINQTEIVTSGASGTGAAGVRAIFLNGLLHGFSLDGMSALLPALTMKSWTTAASFLAASSLGTIGTMSLFAFSIGELSNRLNDVSKSRNVPRILSLVSSVLAIAIGIYWVATSVLAQL